MANKPIDPELKERAIMHLLPPYNWSLRQGEILSLQWEHIDIQHGVAHLPHTKNGSTRDVPLSRKARRLLQDMGIAMTGRSLITHQQASKVPGGQRFSDSIFRICTFTICAMKLSAGYLNWAR